jgi:hypothetical protein
MYLMEITDEGWVASVLAWLKTLQAKRGYLYLLNVNTALGRR